MNRKQFFSTDFTSNSWDIKPMGHPKKLQLCNFSPHYLNLIILCKKIKLGQKQILNYYSSGEILTENEFTILTFSDIGDIESSQLSQSENNSNENKPNLLKSPEYNKTMNQIGKSNLEETVPIIFIKKNKEISKEQNLEIYSNSEKKTYKFEEGGYIGKRIDNKIKRLMLKSKTTKFSGYRLKKYKRF